MSAGSENEQRVRAQVEKWRDELLDLTGRNRLLRFRHTKTSSLEVDSPSAQEVLDRLLAGRSREWGIHLPEEDVGGADLDPTAAIVGLGDEAVRGSVSKPVIEALQRLAATSSGDELWLSFGAIRWRDAGTHAAALLLVPVEVHQGAGWRLRLRGHDMVVNPALVAHFEREFEVDLGEKHYRIENAGIQSYLDGLREGLSPLDAELDDRIGLISADQFAAMQAGELDVTPSVLISESPRDGVLAAMAGADAAAGLPLLGASARVVGLRIPKSRNDTPVLRTTKTSAKDVRAACAGLSRRAAQEFMDKGLWILYLGVGMLHWSDPADGRAEAQDSPLLLVPVRIEPGKGGTEWRVLPSEEEALVNPALWLKLESELGIELPEIDPEEPIDVAATLAAVRAAVEQHAAWTVEERVVLSTFSFHKEAMYRDLRDNLDRIVAAPIVAALATEPGASRHDGEDFAFEPVAEDRLDAEAPPECAATILDADASQRQCIAAATDGRSFVMDGPPGTGKSQTIANQIAELIAGGKTVLFVSEKAAALDVVYDRLTKVHLDEYVLELHSHKTTRATVAAALGQSLLRRPRPAPALTDRELDEVQRRRDELSRYAATLNNPILALGGRSLHHLLGWIAALQHLPHAPVAGRGVYDADELANIQELAELLRSTWQVVDRGEDFVWRGAAAEEWGAAIEQRVQAVLADATAALQTLADVSAEAADDLLLETPAGPAGAAALAHLLHRLEERPDDVPTEWLSETDPAALTEAGQRTVERLRAMATAADRAETLIGRRWRDLDARPDGARRAEVALRGNGFDMPTDLRAADLQRLAGDAGRAAGHVSEVRAVAADLAALLGLRSAELTLSDAEGMVKIVSVATGPDRPEAQWLTSPERLDEAQSAYDVLLPLVRADRRAREAASAFDDAALELDLPALASRFQEEHRGLKKLSGAYRIDRDALGSTAPGLKAKDAIAQIDVAVAWQRERASLGLVLTQHSAALGDAWNGPETDMSAVARQLQAARAAIVAAGGRVVDSVRFSVSTTGTRDAERLAELASLIEVAAARLRSGTPAPLATSLELPLDVAATRLTEAHAALGSTAELVAAVDILRGSASGLADGLDAHAAVGAVVNLTAETDADLDAQELLGERWSRSAQDPQELEDAARWALDTRIALDRRPVTRSTARRLVTTTPSVAEMDGAQRSWTQARDGVLLEFGAARRTTVAEDLDGHFEDARALLDRLRETRGDIATWTAHASAQRSLAAVGLEPAVRFCREQRVPMNQVVDVLRRSALEATADALLAEHAGELGTLRAADRDRLVREYAGLDREVIGDAAHRVMTAANTRRPNTILGVATIIANEAQKKRRHMPVAQLLAKTADVAQAIKPCFMMSPLSVSQFLSPDMTFDVVIFDEASQVRPCDAVNALYRGRAMIVAGDQKQLPPTSFFEQSTDEGDEWTEDSLAEFDSVLDLAKGSGAFRSLSLRWHYRSRHEHLIAFSNHRFYSGDLVTFPSPSEKADDLGVQLLPVEGAYRRGTTRDNPVEAQAVAERVFWHAERGARSIGVVAFSEAQASLIDEVLRQDARRDDPAFASLFAGNRLEALFVKNLENVQGDERNIIIFSVGYGPDEHGKLTMNFGPMNREGGWRRLNVAITRARQRVEVICSFGPERLAPGRGTRGVDELRRYLEFAQRGPAALAIDDGLDDHGGEPESPFEEAVIRSIRSWGYDVVSQVGTAGYRIDMAVRHPSHAGRFALGIECDGAMYHSSRVARDRDRLREQVLDGLGWALHRIWGPSWYRDRSGEERRLREAIERSLLERSAPTPADPETPIAIDFEDLDLEAPPLWAEPYEAAVLPMPSAPEVADVTASAEIRHLLLHTVTEEGPIVEDLLTRRVIGAWGAMVTERRRQSVGRCLAALASAGTLVRDGNAYRLPNQRTDLVRVPAEGDERTEREVKHIPDVELAHALSRLIADARLVTDEEALTRTARLFGWRRNGSAIQAALSRVIEQLIDSGHVSREADHLRLVQETAHD